MTRYVLLQRASYSLDAQWHRATVDLYRILPVQAVPKAEVYRLGISNR